MRIIIVGAGETGTTLSSRFSIMGWDVVLVDVSAEALREAEEGLDVMNMVGDATHRPVLARAGAARADAFIAVSGDDGQNILSAALARRLGAKVAVARVDDPGFFAPGVRVETDLLGVDAVVSTPHLVASMLLDRVLDMHFDSVASFALQGIRVGMLSVKNAPGLHRQAAPNVKLPERAHLAAVLRDGYVRPPTEIDSLSETDQLVLSGPPGAIASAWSALVPGVSEARAIVIGGGDVGVSVVQFLEPHVGRLELIEIDRERARSLAAELGHCTVLCGDGRRNAFLEDLQIDSASFVVATTADDETGLLIALLARRLGVSQTFTFIRQPGHDELFRAVGVEGATGLFDVLANAAADSIIRGGIVGRSSVPHSAYDLVEWRVARSSKPGERGASTLDAVPLPARCRIVALAHDFACVPMTPATRVHPGDSLIILTPRERIADLERNLDRFDKERLR